MENNEILEPKEIEIEKYSEEDYDNLLDELGPIEVCGIKFNPSRILSELDPIAYRCGFSDIQEYETKYVCPICETKHDDYDDAKWCCQEEVNED